ncbi:MAG TPA: heme utilization protein, partial [Rhizobacter sp.]
AHLETADVRALSTTALRAFSPVQIDALESQHFAALTTLQIASFNSDQIGALSNTDLNGFGTQQFAALTSAQVAGLTQTQIYGLETQDLRALSTSAIGALVSDQVAAFAPEHMATLGSHQIAALSTAAIAGLSPAHIVAMTTSQIVGLETRDIFVMTSDQIGAFESDDINVMSNAQLDAMFAATPIVLDLDGDGVRTTAARDGVDFDLNATGTVQRVGWASPTDGFLVLDRNGDGQINDGSELFGTGTRGADGRRAGNGFEAMRFEDSNGDGRLSAADERFGELKVWVDANQDGRADAGELQGLAELGIVSLNLDAVAGTTVDNGNLLGLVSSYTTGDGTQHDLVDVWLAKDRSADLQLGELLAAPAAELLPGAGTAAPTAPAGGSAVPGTSTLYPTLGDTTPLI